MPSDEMEFRSDIRTHELNQFIDFLPRSGRILEIGAGTGWQSMLLSKKGYRVHAIDVPGSVYAQNRVWPVKDYDGVIIPWEDSYFDCVFSSYALEHIPEQLSFQREILRVLKPEGLAVHVIPSPFWRVYSMISHPFKYWKLPGVHGEMAADPFSEIYVFSKRFCRGLFKQAGFELLEGRKVCLFYTGCRIMGRRLSLRARERISRFAGGAGNIYILKKPAK